MKRIDKTSLCTSFLLAIVMLHFCGYDVWAAEESGNWRSTYDLVLKWINFLILVYVMVRFGKTPLLNFLKGQKEKWTQEIKTLEDSKEDAAAKVRQIQRHIEESDSRFAELRDRIIQQGEKKKQEIIESAKRESQMLFNNAQRRIDSHIMEVKGAFKAEMVDAAIGLAMERLPQEITAADNEKLLKDYLDSAHTK
jgi:F-type H+-transporting ATPase subunit b